MGFDRIVKHPITEEILETPYTDKEAIQLVFNQVGKLDLLTLLCLDGLKAVDEGRLEPTSYDQTQLFFIHQKALLLSPPCRLDDEVQFAIPEQ